ncbi:MAG: hypothetical protein RID81_06995 [Sandaracinaceae bacterium]
MTGRDRAEALRGIKLDLALAELRAPSKWASFAETARLTPGECLANLDAARREIEAIRREHGPLLVRIEVTPDTLDVLRQHTKEATRAPLPFGLDVLSFGPGVPVTVSEDLPAAWRAHYSDGTTRDARS